MANSELSSGKSVVIVAIVFGCFAILWPKIFYPMFFGTSEDARRPDHLRPERPPHLGGADFPHPAMRSKDGKLFYGEEGRQLKRTIDKELRPGPVPGMRPSMGGPGLQPQMQHKGQGTMGILMPLYTIGIVIFFVYTVMKIIFKKNDDYNDDRSSTIRDKSSSHLYGQRNPYGGVSQDYLSKMQEHEARNLFNTIKKSQQQAAPAQASKPQAKSPEQEPAASKANTSESKAQEGKATTKVSPDAVDKPAPDTKSDVPNEKVASTTDSKSSSSDKPTVKEQAKTSGVEEICASEDPRDIEIFKLKQRLLETEQAMQKIVAQMTHIQPQEQLGTRVSGASDQKQEVKEQSQSKLEDTSSKDTHKEDREIDHDVKKTSEGAPFPNSESNSSSKCQEAYTEDAPETTKLSDTCDAEDQPDKNDKDVNTEAKIENEAPQPVS